MFAKKLDIMYMLIYECAKEIQKTLKNKLQKVLK
jgi:hypothetical protein